MEIHILQVEKARADTKVVSSGEVGIQASADTGSAVVALEVDTGYAEAEGAGEKTWFVVVENTYSVGVVVGWGSRTASLGYCPTSLARSRDRGRVSVEVVVVVECRVVKFVGVEPVESEPFRIGWAFAKGLTSCIDFEKVEAETWSEAGECSWSRRMIQGPSEASEWAERVGEVERGGEASPLAVTAAK